MPTIRGFVEALEVGRAGLVVAHLLHDDGSRASYRIADLDADPERFNERLSKLGILRDAMDAAEPVEIEFVAEGEVNLIERVRRITRDTLDRSAETQRITGMVMGVAVTVENRTGASAEAADFATVVLLSGGSAQSWRLDMQTPERQVAEAQLAIFRAAQAAGEAVQIDADPKSRRIVTVASGDVTGGGTGEAEPEVIDGFVESIAHSLLESNLMFVEVTTAPPFEEGIGGNVVRLEPFAPQLIKLAVVRGAPEYSLIEAALRDKLRLQVMALSPRGQEDRPRVRGDEGSPGVAAAASARAARLVRGVQLLHALASASRPVWIQILRRSLDVGPDAVCTDGLPSSDLTPQSLRDMGLPYKAEWTGWGCFNHGVYRFQLDLKTEFEILIDGKRLCIHSAEDGGVRFAHACLDGDHEVRVVLPHWSCKQNFAMDVYRIR